MVGSQHVLTIRTIALYSNTDFFYQTWKDRILEKRGIQPFPGSAKVYPAVKVCPINMCSRLCAAWPICGSRDVSEKVSNGVMEQAAYSHHQVKKSIHILFSY